MHEISTIVIVCFENSTDHDSIAVTICRRSMSLSYRRIRAEYNSHSPRYALEVDLAGNRIHRNCVDFDLHICGTLVERCMGRCRYNTVEEP